MCNKLAFSCKTDTPISKELNKIYDCIYLDELNNEKEEYIAVLIDYQRYKNKEEELEKILKEFLESKTTLILLNLEESKVVDRNIGISTRAKNLVIREYNTHRVFNIVQDDEVVLKSGCKNIYSQVGEEALYCNSCFCQSNSCKNKKTTESKNECKSSADSISKMIESEYVLPPGAIIENRVNKKVTNYQSDDSTINDLPPEQYKVIYIDIEYKGPIVDFDGQIASNSIVLELSLIASYRPAYKYLQIRTLGAGLNPGELVSDKKCSRGWFQNKIDIELVPKNNQLRILSNEPQNVNNQTIYETKSNFSVGVDLSSNPGFKPQYNISTTKSALVYDFDIINKTFSNEARWIWQMGITKYKVSNIFNKNIVRQETVKLLPELSKSNLQPVTDTVWYVSNNFNEDVEVVAFLTVEYLKAVVKGGIFGNRILTDKIINRQTIQNEQSIIVKFSTVKA
ncbi:MAG: hypothetical protein ACRCXT_17760 [Paraclostridium sp.]